MPERLHIFKVFSSQFYQGIVLNLLQNDADGMIEHCKKSVETPGYDKKNNGYYQTKVGKAIVAARGKESVSETCRIFRETLCKYCNYQ